MSARSCSRSWQVEAVLDGCLSQADAASFERHAELCEICRAERAALAQLALVAKRLPSATSTPLRRKALHHELLRRAHELSVTARPSRSWRTQGLFALAAVVVGLLVLVGVRIYPGQAFLGARAEPAFELAAAPSTHWRVVEHGSTMRLACDAGTLTISVQKLVQGQRFAITLPDGELEVRGTRFVIEVKDGHTQRLSVTEGRVALRLAHQSEVLVGAGEVWPPERSASVAASGSELAAPAPSAPTSEVARESALVVPPSPLPTGRARASAPTKRTNATSASSGEQAAPPPSDALDFAAAMAAFSRNDFGTAERLFSTFAQRYPRSRHREDVLFLRALCRNRSGDAAGAQALARDYLRQYPNGFRAPEARRLSAL